MALTIEEGQILWLKLPFNNLGEVSKTEHPYVIYKISKNKAELIQLDSMKENHYSFLHKNQFPIFKDNETVIIKDSYASLDNKFTIDLFDDLIKYRKTESKLTDANFNNLKRKYEWYRNKYEINKLKIVHIPEKEIKMFNDIR
jgi:hypothetical protein